MLIAQKIANFNGAQADSLIRKAIGKKKASMFPMIRRCLIYGKKNIPGPEGWEDDNNAPWYDEKQKYGTEISGALSNGYTVEEVDKFFNDLVGFGSYALI